MKRAAPIGAISVLALLAMVIWSVDVPMLTGGVKGDEATYISMALSVVRDGDLKYGQEDYQRFQREMRSGPNGIFLKRGRLPEDRALDYGKPFAYAVAAAPFVAVFGVNGLLLFNVLLLGLSVV